MLRTIVVSGFPGAGKSTVGPRVAALLGAPFLDTDALLAERHRETVPSLWTRLGEGGFRELEADLARELLVDGSPRVIAFGGGTVTITAIRRLALERAFLVTLDASAETLRARTSALDERPTLKTRDPLGRIETLLAERAHAYDECHFRVATDRVSPDEAAARIAEASRLARIVVPLGTRSYRVDVVHDAPLELTEALARTSPSSLVVVTDDNVGALRRDALEAALAPLTLPRCDIVLAAGEENKTLASVETLWRRALEHGVDRDATVFAFGRGGSCPILAGFAASTLLRGVELVVAPTSLLSMVDASVGGKTGFDLSLGKNLVGSFHQPAHVVVDVAHLRTLPDRDLVSGLAEVVKIALAFDASLWDELERDAPLLLARDPAATARVVTRAIAHKARVVGDDEREGGARKLLNLGHTVGHALEAAGAFVRYRHGEAVAIGMAVECAVAVTLGLTTPDVHVRVLALLDRLGLPTRAIGDDLAASVQHLARDKKRAGASVDVPLPLAIGQARTERIALQELGRLVSDVV